MQRVKNAIEKYANRGWTPQVPERGLLADNIWWGTRWIGDSQCWTINLNVQGMKTPSSTLIDPHTGKVFDPTLHHSWHFEPRGSIEEQPDEVVVMADFREWRCLTGVYAMDHEVYKKARFTLNLLEMKYARDGIK